MRRPLKRLFEGALVGSGWARRVIERRGHLAILAYHNIVPQGESRVGEWSLHLPQSVFADQLDKLCETHRVVGLDEAFETIGASEAPMAAVTFDDGYVGALTAGVEELRKRGLAATVFVNPGALAWSGFWWDRLADPRTGELSNSMRQHALGVLGGRQEHICAWAKSEGSPMAMLPEHARPGSLSRLREAASFDGLALGSHSWAHARLPALPAGELREDLAHTLAWLRESFPRVSSWISYPYGDGSASVANVAAELHRGGLLVSGGLIPGRAPTDPFRTPRLNIPSGLSRDGFVLRLAGRRPGA